MVRIWIALSSLCELRRLGVPSIKWENAISTLCRLLEFLFVFIYSSLFASKVVCMFFIGVASVQLFPFFCQSWTGLYEVAWCVCFWVFVCGEFTPLMRDVRQFNFVDSKSTSYLRIDFKLKNEIQVDVVLKK